MISDVYKEDKKVKIRWKYCLFRLMTLYIGYGTKNVVVIKEWKIGHWFVMRSNLWGARVAHCGENTRLPPITVAQVQILASTSYVVWVCFWFSLFLQEVFLRVLRFSLLLKTNATLPNSNSFWNAWTRFNLYTYYNLPSQQSQLWVAIKLTAASDFPCMKTSKVETAKGCFFLHIWKIWEICLWQNPCKLFYVI